ncbi:hypothetical protein [Streptantibioticus silvisoli]|uniref:LamG domain-containing protein n=1 Tax=Streptantibioticus silvisoli TaxID=2705255 RepID=A0ABT6W4N5_9ACTN|nr:hypothetical protein [Streptantibioticus silvisoli]MDI5965713.1 hypothetical protein [Streptantibioticus silvisoli]
MANPKIGTLADDFTGAINTVLWGAITAGAATLDTVNNQVQLAIPTTSGTVNSFGTTAVYDATSSSVAARVGVAANGNGSTKTVARVRRDANNSIAMAVEAGAFHLNLMTAGSTVTTVLPAYSPDTHRWWRIREATGTFYADTSPDGLNWTQQASAAYTWDATAVTLAFESQAAATEVSGNLSLIANVNTRRGGAANQNWPTVVEAWGPSQTVNGATSPVTNLVALTGRTQGATSVKRGRQYELDEIQSGTYDVTLANKDGSLDPLNSGGPWYGHVLPYQPYRKHAQWPPTPNLMSQYLATGGDIGGAAGLIPATARVSSGTDTSGGSVVATAGAWQGGNVLQFAVPVSTASGTAICYTARVAPDPGQPVAHTVRARCVTVSSSLSAQAFIAFYTAAGVLASQTNGAATTLTGGTPAAWSTLAVSVAASPTGAAYMVVGVQTALTATSTANIQADGWQVEKAPSPSAWVAPGTWSPIYAGFVERWPSTWTMSGTYGVVSATAVDALAMLSQVTLTDPLSQEIQYRSPRYLYPLSDPGGVQAATDSTGANPVAPVGNGKYGSGTVTFGTSITASAASGTYLNDNSVATFTTTTPGAGTGAISFLDLTKAGIVAPVGGTWTRMIAFRWSGGTAPTGEADIWAATAGSATLAQLRNQLILCLDNTGALSFRFGNSSAGTSSVAAGGGDVADGNWHLALFGYSGITSANMFVSIDGGYNTASPGGSAASWIPSGLVSNTVGANYDVTTHAALSAFAGDISYVAEFPTALSPADCAALYGAWRSQCAGESTDARYARILRYAGYTGGTSLQAGLTTNMGPASDLSGTDAFSALEAVVDTEAGSHFVARDGTVTFQSRGNRYNSLAPVYTFGENTASGEWPYEDCQLDYDPTHLGNQVQVTQQSTNQIFSAQDSTSIAEYFPRSLTRTVNAASAAECQDAAGYLVSRYKQPLVRVDSIKLHPSAFPSLWPVCLSLELGMRVRVMRRPPSPAAPIQVDCFIESIQVDMDDTGEAFWTLQCSPVDPLLYGVFAAFHTTLATAASTGATTVTINAGQDSTNPAAAQLAAGQQLVLGQGTANAETVAILSVGATTTGWTTATLTLTAATTKSHSAGDVVCEPLPAGVTDPSTWDIVAKFDSSSFAY